MAEGGRTWAGVDCEKARSSSGAPTVKLNFGPEGRGIKSTGVEQVMNVAKIGPSKGKGMSGVKKGRNAESKGKFITRTKSMKGEKKNRAQS